MTSGTADATPPTMEGVDAHAAVASVFVLPRLAALGPSLDLRALNALAEDGRTVLARAGNMLLATLVGLLTLVGPLSALAYAADRIAGVNPTVMNQHVPGGIVRPHPGGDRLTPAGDTDQPR